MSLSQESSNSLRPNIRKEIRTLRPEILRKLMGNTLEREHVRSEKK